jgi:hypothetical protein
MPDRGGLLKWDGVQINYNSISQQTWDEKASACMMRRRLLHVQVTLAVIAIS